MYSRFSLKNEWKFKVVNDENYKNSSVKNSKLLRWNKAEIPGTVHTDLLKNKFIEKPFYADNELKLAWVSNLNWIYKTSFDLPQNFFSQDSIYLIFQGIDTIAEVFLNSTRIALTDNMFLRYEFDISKKVKRKNNILGVKFYSPIKYAKKLESKHGKLPASDHSERVYLRKAQYSFGWDWGPSFPTSGIWRDVYLIHKPELYIEGLKFDTLSIKKNSALVNVSAELNKNLPKEYKLKLELKNGSEIIEKDVGNNKKSYSVPLTVRNPKLWWPNGVGAQNLYDLSVMIFNEKDGLVNSKTIKVGIRTVELKLFEKDKPQFQFIINGKPIFIKGADWIPVDSFLSRVKKGKYRDLLSLAKNANMNMIRVWGGGIYEDEIFYELCDEMGLLVWQDFMFACASYPEYDEFIKNVKKEVVQNVKRLQNHPSIAIWCGNNENEWSWFRENKESYKNMPGYRIYHEHILKILNDLDPHRPYWPSTPFGFDDDPNSELSGNRHKWDLWSGWVDYKEVKDDKSLFVSEFGFQSVANFKTISNVLPGEERNVQSRAFEFHNKQVEGNERLFKFLVTHLPVKTGLKDFVYLNQLNQGLALKECIEHWRSRFPKTNGSIIWQLNDCWPVSSWSLIDSDIIPKLSYYLVKESFKNVITVLNKNGNKIEVYVLNQSVDDYKGRTKIDFVSLPAGVVKNYTKVDVSVDRFGKKLCAKLDNVESIETGKIIVIASLYNAKSELIHRNFYCGVEWKHLRLSKTNIKVIKKNNNLVITSNKPSFFVNVVSGYKSLNENGFIILPKEKFVIRTSSNDKFVGRIKTTSLNDYLSKR